MANESNLNPIENQGLQLDLSRTVRTKGLSLDHSANAESKFALRCDELFLGHCIQMPQVNVLLGILEMF